MDWTHAYEDPALEANSSSNIHAKADDFSENVSRVKQLLDLRLSDFLLDVGCHEGAYDVALAPFVAHLVGIDTCTLLIERARAKHIENAEFQVANANILPFPNATFDKVLASSVIQFCEPQALQEMERVLKPTGKILIQHIPNIAFRRWYLDGIGKLDKTEEEKQNIRARNEAVKWYDPKDFDCVIPDTIPYFFSVLKTPTNQEIL